MQFLPPRYKDTKKRKMKVLDLIRFSSPGLSKFLVPWCLGGEKVGFVRVS
jgi:hypothetical protein